MLSLNEVNGYTIPLSHCSVILECIKCSYKLYKQWPFIHWLFCVDLQFKTMLIYTFLNI